MITDGDTIDGTEFRLEVLHTPGHAPNHLCFFLDEERMLFTGDTILGGMTSGRNDDLVSTTFGATEVTVEETASGGTLAWHTAPVRQLVVTLAGTLVFTTRDGEEFRLSPGDVLLAEDTTGSGHQRRLEGSGSTNCTNAPRSAGWPRCSIQNSTAEVESVEAAHPPCAGGEIRRHRKTSRPRPIEPSPKS